MAVKPHLRLDTGRQTDGAVKLKFNYGFPDEEESERAPAPNYYPLAQSFRGYLNRYNEDVLRRSEQRNPTLEVPSNIDYIRIVFQDQFSIRTNKSNHYENWFNDFGLLGVNFSQFNKEVLFAVTDREKFEIFVQNILNFISKETNENPSAEYLPRIKYIKEFRLFTSEDIIRFEGESQLLNFRLMEFPLPETSVTTIYQALVSYLDSRDIPYRLIEETSNLEVYRSTIEQVTEIVQNFDIVLSVTSSLATVIRPTEFNVPERTYGFEIENPADDLPIIGVLDTGVSNQTPLASIIIDDDGFNLTTSSPFEDNAFGGDGHGTPVAALASLGKRPYSDEYRGTYTADARILSMKILDGNSGYISELEVLNLLTEAKRKYPDIKIFVLTTCYQNHKKVNEDYSTYSYELDKFAHENDCLIFICTGNNHNACNENTAYDLAYFSEERTNLCVPAESLNNVVVGGAADCLQEGIFYGISSSREFPTLFSRKSHIDLTRIFTKKRNKNFFRPDVLESAGDYEQSNNFIGSGERATINLLSANRTRGFTKDVGTSFSAPLVSNIAARIQRFYPQLRAQTIKALIINGACLDAIRFPDVRKSLLNKTAGHGLVSAENSLFSNDNRLTIIVEDQIAPEEVKLIPINFPRYLTEDDLGKKTGLLKVTATLCFSFEPILNNQLSYCPIHIAFNFYRNQSGDDIQRPEKDIKSRLRQNMKWSQDARHKAKPVPYFNTHKINFLIGIDDFISENHRLKLAVACRISSQLLPGQESRYINPHKFSIAITVEENLKDSKLTGKLYSEMELVNELEALTGLDLEAQAEQ